jgi:hypothetical protein
MRRQRAFRDLGLLYFVQELFGKRVSRSIMAYKLTSTAVLKVGDRVMGEGAYSREVPVSRLRDYVEK